MPSSSNNSVRGRVFRQDAETEKLKSPERNLLAAVLDRAIADLCNGTTDSEGFKGDARRWIYSSNKNENSFLWICHNLELDPHVVRKEIAKFESGEEKYNRR